MGATARLRVGQIVPSSNITMETEIPALLRRHAEHTGDVEFTFHSSRMRMKTVSKDELAAMDADSDRCAPADPNSDAHCNAHTHSSTYARTDSNCHPCPRPVCHARADCSLYGSAYLGVGAPGVGGAGSAGNWGGAAADPKHARWNSVFAAQTYYPDCDSGRNKRICCGGVLLSGIQETLGPSRL